MKTDGSIPVADIANVEAWATLRDMAGKDISAYAALHDDEWSRDNAFQTAYRRLMTAYHRAVVTK